jgi:hypothetical protein
MKKVLILITTAILVLTLIACEFAGITLDLGGGGDSGGAKAAPVEAGIDSPGNNATLPMGPVEIAYHASSTDGIAAVELSIDGAVVSSITTPSSDQKVVALKYTWNPTTVGSHTIRVRAQSSGGNWSDFYGVIVTIQEGEQAQQPPAAEQTQQPAPTDTPEATATPKEMQIYDVKTDKNIFYYGGGGCNREITISARITHPEQAYTVTLFIRLRDKEGEGSTGWDSGRGMSKKGEDTYSVTLFSEKIPKYSQYEFALMDYQIVVQDKERNTIAKISPINGQVTLQICQ